jgi:sirohydrochlorin ferrochelatase
MNATADSFRAPETSLALRSCDNGAAAPLVLAAHGTRDRAGIAELETLAQAVRDRLGSVPVSVGYVDVLGPSVAEVLSHGAVIVPAFLAAGYHVRVDVPAAITSGNRRDVLVTAALGADPRLVEVAADRLAAAGRRPGDAVVLAAVGSSDPRALVDVRLAGKRLAARLRTPVHIGYVATGGPSVADRVTRLRTAGAERVAAASWLLAPGRFQRRLADSGADVVAAPLGAHPLVVDAVVHRYRSAVTASAA